MRHIFEIILGSLFVIAQLLKVFKVFTQLDAIYYMLAFGIVWVIMAIHNK